MLMNFMEMFNKSRFGLYRDDGLMVIRGGGPDVDRARKDVIEIFKLEGNST